MMRFIFLIEFYLVFFASFYFQRNPAAVFPDHYNLPTSSKQLIFTDDENLSDEEYDKTTNKRYANIAIRGGSTMIGDSRIWPIPYRFGKRAAMPYRFGKRADMHFRLGKRSVSL